MPLNAHLGIAQCDVNEDTSVLTLNHPILIIHFITPIKD